MIQLIQGLYSYFVTGKPSFHLNRSIGKEGELKIQEFYDRIVESYDSFDEFYSPTSFKQVRNFNAEYVRNNRKLFHERFKEVLSSDHLRFLLSKLEEDWSKRRNGVRTDTNGQQVPVLGYANLTIIDHIVGTLEMLKKVTNIDNGKQLVQNSFNELNEFNESPFRRKNNSIELSLQDKSGTTLNSLSELPEPNLSSTVVSRPVDLLDEGLVQVYRAFYLLLTVRPKTHLIGHV